MFLTGENNPLIKLQIKDVNILNKLKNINISRTFEKGLLIYNDNPLIENNFKYYDGLKQIRKYKISKILKRKNDMGC